MAINDLDYCSFCGYVIPYGKGRSKDHSDISREMLCDRCYRIHRDIKSFDKLIAEKFDSTIKYNKQKIVFTNGCFDILHKGHIAYLNEAKKLGTCLIIGLNSDASVRRLKNNNRPINKEQDRKYVLENLSCVDEVIIFEEDTPYELIKKIKPNVLVKGGDWKKEEIIGADLVEDTIVIDYRDGYSTTETINKIKIA